MTKPKHTAIARYSSTNIFSPLSPIAMKLVQNGAKLKRIVARAKGMFSSDHVYKMNVATPKQERKLMVKAI